MASLTFAEMNNGQKEQYYKRRARVGIAGKWVSILTPFIAVFFAKINEYVTILEDQDKIKLTIGGVLAIVVAGIAVYKEIKKGDSSKKISGAVGWGLAFLICYLCKAIIDDLVLILGTEFAGQCVALGFDKYTTSCAKEVTFYNEEAKKDGTVIVKGLKLWKKK